MSIGIKPLKDNVALKVKTVEESTTSGIIIPGDKDEQKNFAEVVAVGDGTKDEPIIVKVGDTVLFSEYAGTKVKHDSEEYIIVKQDSILAIIE